MGASPSPFNVQLTLIMALMLGAALVASSGVVRITGSGTGLRAA